jgi:hypothetical protein
MSIPAGPHRAQDSPAAPRLGDHDEHEPPPLPVATPRKHLHTHTVELLRTEADARHACAVTLAARIHSHRIG